MKLFRLIPLAGVALTLGVIAPPRAALANATSAHANIANSAEQKKSDPPPRPRPKPGPKDGGGDD